MEKSRIGSLPRARPMERDRLAAHRGPAADPVPTVEDRALVAGRARARTAGLAKALDREDPRRAARDPTPRDRTRAAPADRGPAPARREAPRVMAARRT